MKGLSFAAVVLRARSNKIEDIRPLMPRILEALPVAEPGHVAVVE